jgi:hypothetical protein
MQNRIFSFDDNAKAAKAAAFGYLNAIHYLAPADVGGAGNLCPHASAGCLALCLGWFSGHAAIGEVNNVRDSRVAKTRRFMHDRKAYLADMVRAIEGLQRKAIARKVKLCVRLNGSSDIPWEGIRTDSGRTLFEQFPGVQFVDYTKSLKRALRHARGELAPNYHLTFSRSETNEAEAVQVLDAGGSVAVVSSLPKPDSYLAAPAIDGDKHDLRHLDGRGVIVWLSPKGAKAKADKSGFVVR